MRSNLFYLLLFFLVNLFLYIGLNDVFAQDINIVEGTVYSESSSTPLAGVSVLAIGKNDGVVTDENGKFSIANISSSDTLVFSFVGYKSVKEPIGNRKQIDVSLVLSSSMLERVVVVGYGTRKEVNVTGAISSIDYDSVLERRPITSASQALSGQVSGLWVSQNSGKPGDDGAQLRVRGWGTLNNSDPLVLIDGFEASMDQINPSDIASISVLKDASSAAIYGSRAANGVILITTKSGKLNQPLKISISSYIGEQKLGRHFDLVNNSVDYMNLWNDAIINQGGDPLFPDSVINSFKINKNDPYRYPNTDFFKYVFRTAPITNNNLSLSGGSDNTTYYLSFNYQNQQGIILRTNSEKYGLTMNVNSKLNKWLSLGGRFNGIMQTSNEPFNLGGRVLYIFANGAYPFTAPKTEDGRFGAPEALINGQPIVGNRNPLIETQNGKSTTETGFYKMGGQVGIKFTDYLNFRSEIAIQLNHNLNSEYNTVVNGYTDGGVPALNLDYITTLQSDRSSIDNFQSVWFNTLNFNKDFAGGHNISVMAGMQVENKNIKNLYGISKNPPKEGLTQIDAGTDQISANGNMQALRTLSFFGRIDYSYLDKYLLEFNLRSDASSRFREGRRWGTFPGLSLGWRLDQENFLRNSNSISNLKLRLSYGVLGNNNINDFWPYLSSVEQSDGNSYSFGGTLSPGAAITALKNNDITWETTTDQNIGIDFGLFKNKFFGSLTYFNKYTKNIIVQLPIPLTLGGLTPPFQNIGRMKNTGFEAELGFSNHIMDRSMLNFSGNLNLTYINNKVTKFQGGKSPDQLYLIREDYSYNTLYGLNAIGVFQSDDEADEYMFANGYKPEAGDLKFEDVNGDGKIDFRDKKAMGNTIPKFTYGANLNFDYLGFNLNFLLQGQAGVHDYTMNAWTQPLGISGGTITKRWLNAWTPENPSTSIPHIKIPDTWNYQESSFWVYNTSYLKVRNIQVGYSFPERGLKEMGIEKLFLFLNFQNLITIVNKSYEGFDPEKNTFQSVPNSYYPTPKIYSFGINIDF